MSRPCRRAYPPRRLAAPDRIATRRHPDRYTNSWVSSERLNLGGRGRATQPVDRRALRLLVAFVRTPARCLRQDTPFFSHPEPHASRLLPRLEPSNSALRGSVPSCLDRL